MSKSIDDLLSPVSTHTEDYLEDEQASFIAAARKAAALAFGADPEGRRAAREHPYDESTPEEKAVADAFGIRQTK